MSLDKTSQDGGQIAPSWEPLVYTRRDGVAAMSPEQRMASSLTQSPLGPQLLPHPPILPHPTFLPLLTPRLLVLVCPSCSLVRDSVFALSPAWNALCTFPSPVSTWLISSPIWVSAQMSLTWRHLLPDLSPWNHSFLPWEKLISLPFYCTYSPKLTKKKKKERKGCGKKLREQADSLFSMIF